MYIDRDIDEVLEKWKNEKKRKPLILRGIRQCGKTSAIRHLAEKFEYYVEINLEKQSSLCEVYEGDIEVKKIISRFEIESSLRIIPGKTLLFIDEIQVCPKAITALRYFYEDMSDLHVIAAGSLLEFVLRGKKEETHYDFPVGRVRSIFMYPFSFKEYLRGTDHEILSEYMDHLDIETDSNEIHEKIIEHYKTFLIVGGMPEAVADYYEKRSFISCQQIHRDILLNMLDDFDKYDRSISSDQLRKVFDYAMHNICNQTKSSSAIEGMSAYYFDECIKLLKRAGILFPVKASSCDAIPLGAKEKEANKKLLIFDTGVYLTECRLDIGNLLAATVFDDMNKGDVVEMQTGLEMIKNADSYTESSLYYWYRSGANAEVDYVIQKDDNIIPVEVKASGKGSMQSMQSFLRIHPKSPYGIRVSLENFCKYDNIRVYPVYAIDKIVSSKT